MNVDLKEDLIQIIYNRFGNINFNKNILGFVAFISLSKNSDIRSLKNKILSFLKGKFREDINLSESFFILLNDIEERPKCPVCGKPTKFRNFNIGYLEFCSIKCMSIGTRERVKKSNLEKYGFEYTFQIPEVKERIRKVNIIKYNTPNPMSCPEVQEKYKESMRNKYGVDFPLQNEKIKKKVKETNLRRYGVEHVSQIPEVKEKTKATNRRKFGVDFPAQSSEIIGKTKRYFLEKYGVDNPMKTEEFKIKNRMAIRNKYGVDNPMKAEEVKDTIRKTCLDRYGVSNVSRTIEVKEKLRKTNLKKFHKRLLESNRLKDLVVPLFDLESYDGVQFKYPFRCVKCNQEFIATLDNGNIPRCFHCFPRFIGISKYEKEITSFLEENSFRISRNDRKVLDGKEIDILIPEKNLGIEFDGLYWHGELNGCSKNYHSEKTDECLKKGIHLIHIFEDEWLDKQDVIKSILLAKLGVFKNRIYARKCEINEINLGLTKDFLFDNHLQGPINSKLNLGLFFENKLVSVLSLGKSRFNKNYEWEILRFCSVLNTQVLGGLGKLFRYFVENYDFESIITYSDRRFGGGNSYEKVGFKYLYISSPGYFYMKNFKRYPRQRFQKKYLKNRLGVFDPNLTEWENMQLNGYDRIWDCGNYVYEWRRN